MSESGTVTTTNSHLIILLDASDGDLVVTLPSPSANRSFNLKRVDDSIHGVTILTPSGTFDGASSLTLNLQYDAYQLISDDSNYFVMTSTRGTSQFSLDFSQVRNSMYYPGVI